MKDRLAQLELIADHAPVLLAHCSADLRYNFVNRLVVRIAAKASTITSSSR